MIKDEEQFNKKWLETYALVGCKIKDFRDGGKNGEIGKIIERDIAYNDNELKKLTMQIYQSIVDLMKSQKDKEISLQFDTKDSDGI